MKSAKMKPFNFFLNMDSNLQFWNSHKVMHFISAKTKEQNHQAERKKV